MNAEDRREVKMSPALKSLACSAEADKAFGLRFLHALIIRATGAQDVYYNWQAIRKVEDGDALMVRPDCIVAWRHNKGFVRLNHCGRTILLYIHPSHNTPAIDAPFRESSRHQSAMR